MLAIQNTGLREELYAHGGLDQLSSRVERERPLVYGFVQESFLENDVRSIAEQQRSSVNQRLSVVVWIDAVTGHGIESLVRRKVLQWK
jgi:phosphoserine aminotransferase